VWWCNKHIHQEFGNLHIDHGGFCVCLKYCVWVWLHRSFCSNYPCSRQVQQSGGCFNEISHQNNLQLGVLVPNCEHHGTSSVILLYLKNNVQGSEFFLDDRSTVLGVPLICLSGVLWLLGKHMDDLFLDISAPQSPQSRVEVGWYDCNKALLTQVIAQHRVMLAADFLKVSSFFRRGSLWVFFKILRMWEMPWELNRRKREGQYC
jgi:hypothetical protein